MCNSLDLPLNISGTYVHVIVTSLKLKMLIAVLTQYKSTCLHFCFYICQIKILSYKLHVYEFAYHKFSSKSHTCTSFISFICRYGCVDFVIAQLTL